MSNHEKLTLITNRSYDRDITFYSETKSVAEFNTETNKFLQQIIHQIANPVLKQLEKQLSNLITKLEPCYEKTKTAYEKRIAIAKTGSRQQKIKLTRIATKETYKLKDCIYNNRHIIVNEIPTEYQAIIKDILDIYYAEIINLDNLNDYTSLEKIPEILKIAEELIAAPKNKELRTTTLTALTNNTLPNNKLKTTWRYRNDKDIKIFKNYHLLKFVLNNADQTSYREYLQNLGWKSTKNIIKSEVV
jgi:acetolactate synthase small subunit